VTKFPLRVFALELLASLSIGGFALRGMAQDHPAAGPAWQTFDLTLQPGKRTEIAGPFYYHQHSDAESTRAWPPFYSRYQNSVGSREDDFLYPLLTYEAQGEEFRWQLFELFSFAGGANPDGGSTKRTTIYPLYFEQRSADSNENYTAFVPFYGHIKHRLLLNDVFFVMFPLYTETRNHGYVTKNYLYPFFHLRHGDHLEGWQFWPVMGEEHKDITTATNGFGDVSVVPGHDKFFALWPIFYNNTTGLGTDNPDHSLAVLPFYAKTRSPLRNSTSVIWPFFTWIDDRERRYHEWQGPWPLVIFTRGEGKHTDRVWPLFSQSRITKPAGDSGFSLDFGGAVPTNSPEPATAESDSYLWPLYQYRGFHSPPLDEKRQRVLFFVYENTVEKNTDTGKEKQRVDVWPFFTWHRDAAGSQRLQIFAPVEPVVPDNAGIERNWSPLWSLWRAEDNATNGHKSRSLLWNLYREETTPDHQNSSLLFGLFRYKQEGEFKQLRCFYGLTFRWH
jgi:hypothetical protein